MANRRFRDPRCWGLNDDGRRLTLSFAFRVINLAYVLMGIAGLCPNPAFFGIGLFVFFLLLRSLFLGTLENPKPRYSLEGYPALIVLASDSVALGQ